MRPVTWYMALQLPRRACLAILVFAFVLSSVHGVFGEEIFADFGNDGLWRHHTGGWAPATHLDAAVLAPWSGGIGVGFADGLGFFSYDGTSWSQLTIWDPYVAVAWNGDLVAAFDAGRGLWRYASSSWSQLTDWEPVELQAHEDRLLASFGPGKGLWSYESESWRELTPWHPTTFVPWNERIVASFDSGRGVWLHDGSSWSQLTHREAGALATFDDGLVMSLEPELGLWLYDGSSFSQLTSWHPYAVLGENGRLVAAFDGERGLWEYRSGTGWVYLSDWEPVHVEVVASGIVADFGHGRGLWMHGNVDGWTNLTAWNSEQLDSADPSDQGATDPLDIASDVPDVPYCQDVKFWNPSWRRLEDEILDIVNQRRSEGADCGAEGTFGPATALATDAALRCAARVHSKDMVERAFFSHTNPDGESPWDRFAHAGYTFSSAGENIAAGNATAETTMSQWMSSDGHCANVMYENFSELGVGYYPGGSYGHYWTQAFGRPN